MSLRTGKACSDNMTRTPTAESEILIYSAPDGTIKIDVRLENETLWLTQKAMAGLFGVNVPAISKHIDNIFESGELERSSTVSKMEIVQKEGAREVNRQVDHFNLDVVIAVGYRVNSHLATQFRIWQTG
jgi:hypothetical protein